MGRRLGWKRIVLVEEDSIGGSNAANILSHFQALIHLPESTYQEETCKTDACRMLTDGVAGEGKETIVASVMLHTMGTVGLAKGVAEKKPCGSANYLAFVFLFLYRLSG